MRLTRFDKTVLLIITAVAVAVLFLTWRGDRVGLQITRMSPAAGSREVSTRATFRATFNQEMFTRSDITLATEPPLAGTVRWESNRTLLFEPADLLQPGTTYTITIPAGLAGQRGRKLLQPFTWQFHTGQPRLIYIAWDVTRSGNQLFTISARGGTPQQLTQEPLNILDYTVAPDGQTIAYTSTRPDGGSDLWLIAADGSDRRELLKCPQGACSQVVWSPDGRRLIYERRTYLEPGAPLGPPRLWWLDMKTRETTAVFQDSQWIGLGAQLSPDGQWLSYVTPQTQAVQLYNLLTGQNSTFNSGTGEPPVWSPTSDKLLATQVIFTEDAFAIHLINLAVPGGEATDISRAPEVTDSWPAYSPQGDWIAFTRKGVLATEGKQVWLMRPDGREAVAVTHNPAVHFGPPKWSPDGRFLTFQGYSLSQRDQPAVWVYDVTTGETERVVTPGIQPNWLP